MTTVGEYWVEVGEVETVRMDRAGCLERGDFVFMRNLMVFNRYEGSVTNRRLTHSRQASKPRRSGLLPPGLPHGQASSLSRSRVDGKEGKAPSRLPQANR